VRDPAPEENQEKKLKDHLFFVFAFVPTEAGNRFHIATQKEVNAALKAKYEVDRTRTIAKGKAMPSEDQGVLLPTVQA